MIVYSIGGEQCLAVVILQQLIEDGTNILSTFELSEMQHAVDSTEQCLQQRFSGLSQPTRNGILFHLQLQSYLLLRQTCFVVQLVLLCFPSSLARAATKTSLI